MDHPPPAGDALPPELDAYLRNDPLAAHLGIELDSLRKGFASARMTVAATTLNAHGAAHGGATMTLIDVVHAAVSNSHGTSAVALDVHTEFLGGAGIGDVLVCQGIELTCTRSTAVYRITVHRESDQRPVAEALARVFRRTDRLP